MKQQTAPLYVLVLAAGAGTRMKSKIPKVLHALGEKPMIARVINAATALKPKRIGVVVGHGGSLVEEKLQSLGLDVDIIWQKQQRGSGDAVISAGPWLKRALTQNHSAQCLILCADTPLVRSQTLKDLRRVHCKEKFPATVCTMQVDDPYGYGRILRDSSGRVRGIREEKDATPEEKRITEVNTGIYYWNMQSLTQTLPLLKNNNAKKEYYLTDTIDLLHSSGQRVASHCLPLNRAQNSLNETQGINTREELYWAEKELYLKVARRWMAQGVTIFSPETTFISEGVQIGQDSTLLPGTVLRGKTKVGSFTVIGPNTWIENSRIHDQVTIRASFIYGSNIHNSAQIGPYAHLRPGTVVMEGARIGNFTEIKSSRIGKKSKVSHLSYIGDAILGESINVGAGAITCNFDGLAKYKTSVGSGSFIGSNVNLVAPLTVGKGAVVGAGSTITKNVPANSLSLERSQQIVKQNWPLHRQDRKKK